MEQFGLLNIKDPRPMENADALAFFACSNESG